MIRFCLMFVIYVALLYTDSNALKKPMSIISNTLLRARNIQLPQEDKIYLHVPYDEKSFVKNLGARWDPEEKKWFINSFQPVETFYPWILQYLNVPYSEKDEAKTNGAQWDPDRQKWYTSNGVVDSNPIFLKWLAGNGSMDSSNTTFPVPHSYVQKLGDGVLFFDIDTNGLPQRRKGMTYAPYNDISAYNSSRIVQLSCMLCDRVSLEPVKSVSTIIKADEFPIDNTQYHGITEEKSLKEGTFFLIVVQQILPMLRQAKYIVSHNAEFDIVIFKSELFRYGLSSALQQVESLKPVCTMHLTKPLLGLSDKNGNLKNPSLKELYSYATEDKDFGGTTLDVEKLHYAIKALAEKGMIDKVFD